MARAAPAVATGMRKVDRRFGRWRRSHQGRPRIPEPLWILAPEWAKEHGVFRAARILGLDYSTLKRRVGSAGAVARRTAPAALVELMAPPAAGLAERWVE